jgi:hypothetical protein
VKSVDKNGNEGLMSAGGGVSTTSVFSIRDSIVVGEGTVPGQFSGITRGDIDSLGQIFVYDRAGDRLQMFDPAGSFMKVIKEGFNTAIGFALRTDIDFYAADRGTMSIMRLDTSGNTISEWTVAADPRAVLFLNNSLYVLTHEGIEVYDSSDSLVRTIDLALDFSTTGGDFAVSEGGNIMFVDGVDVYGLDLATDSVVLVHHIEDNLHNQNPRLNSLADGRILLSTTGSSRPFRSSHYVLDSDGELIARWYSEEPITDVLVQPDGSLLGLTSTGRFLYLQKHF